MDYVKRIARGFEVNISTLAADVVKAVGPGGNFLAEQHTIEHFRRELWLPGTAWTRQSFAAWESEGRTSIADRALREVNRILTTHKHQPIDETLARELDRIVDSARSELT
jgi:trimethylamine--corrinoid protein Co-methyltransferase